MKTNLKVKQLRKLSHLASGRFHGMKKSELIETVLKYQEDTNKLLIETENGLEINPDVNIYDYGEWEKTIGHKY
jgi:hypothetical protein